MDMGSVSSAHRNKAVQGFSNDLEPSIFFPMAPFDAYLPFSDFSTYPPVLSFARISPERINGRNN
jgi:hypothetical protein